jgi:hypothetical protein
VNRVRRDVVLLVASLAVFAVCAVVVADGRVGPIERAAFDAVNGLPDWLYRPMLAFQYLGVLAMPLVVALGALALRRWRLAAALVLVVPLKLGLERSSSCWCNGSVQEPQSQTQSCGGAPGRAELCLRACHHHLAIAGLLALVLPRRWAVVAFVLATLNAVARVYLGAHNPLAEVGGAAVGLAIAAALDLVLDVARDHGGSRHGQAAPTGKDRAT